MLNDTNRRTLLLNSLKYGAAIALASSVELFAARPQSSSISFYHTHTGDRLTVKIIDGSVSELAKQRLNHFLRDFRTGEIHPIDPTLFGMLQRIQQVAGSSGEFEVISGYRSPETNNHLRSQSAGIAKNSFHTSGKALDIRLTDIPTRDVRDIAMDLRVGGVGYYERSNFVHIDTGPVRS